MLNRCNKTSYKCKTAVNLNECSNVHFLWLVNCSTHFPLSVCLQLHYNSKMLKTESPIASRGSSLPRTLSKESKLYGMRDSPAPPASGPGKTNTLLPPPPPPPPLPSGTHSVHLSSSADGFLHALSLISALEPTALSSTVAHDYLGTVFTVATRQDLFFRCVVFNADVTLLGLRQASIISCYYNIIGNNFTNFFADSN